MTDAALSASQLPPGLYVVATPIGNLGDISSRAIQVLKDCDLIACEDTRTSRKLLDRFDIQKQLISYHDHNEKQQAEHLVDKIREGARIALISDAGTPCISDPGFRVVRACRKAGVDAIPLPGPNAAIVALSVSGLPTDRFLFMGFLPPKSAARKRTFEEYKNFQHSMVYFESSHRIDKFMKELLAVLGPDRWVCVAREITKLHETILTAPLAELLPSLEQRSSKGEFVVVVAPATYQL